VLPRHVDAEGEEALRKLGEAVRTNRILVGHGRQTTVYSQRRAVPYTLTRQVKGEAEKVLHVTWDGISARLRATVSADRRFVRLDLSQELLEFQGLRKLHAGDPNWGGDSETPMIQRTELRAAIETGDGHAIVLPLLSSADAPKERVRVLIVRPVIHIEEEERELRKEKKS